MHALYSTGVRSPRVARAHPGLPVTGGVGGMVYGDHGGGGGMQPISGPLDFGGHVHVVTHGSKCPRPRVTGDGW
jgi:hypothetical protein